MRASCIVSIGAADLQHDSARHADPLDVWIAKALDRSLAAIRTGDRCGRGCSPKSALYEVEGPTYSSNKTSGTSALISTFPPGAGRSSGSGPDASSLNDQVVEDNVVRAAGLVLA